jgi:DNA-binding HxlR family transcriptional regulator
MSKYGQFCPVARSLEILGDRWTLLIIRDMLIGGITHFNDLERSLPGISRGLLARRLKQLQHAGVIEKQTSATNPNATEYHLTQAGMELQETLMALMIWGEAWAFAEPTPEELDPVLLMWWLRADVQKDKLPQPRVVVQYDFHVDKKGMFWLILTSSDVTLCVTDPGFEIDVLVTANLTAFYNLWWGRITYEQATERYGVTVEGTPRMVRAFPDLFAWSAAAGLNYVKVRRQMQTQAHLIEVGSSGVPGD